MVSIMETQSASGPSLLLSNWHSLPASSTSLPLTNGAKTQLGSECSLLSFHPASDGHLSRARKRCERGKGRGELVTERD